MLLCKHLTTSSALGQSAMEHMAWAFTCSSTIAKIGENLSSRVSLLRLNPPSKRTRSAHGAETMRRGVDPQTNEAQESARKTIVTERDGKVGCRENDRDRAMDTGAKMMEPERNGDMNKHEHDRE